MVLVILLINVSFAFPSPPFLYIYSSLFIVGVMNDYSLYAEEDF